ncbi:hypothetical protein [Massilia sp.]|uniref:hypothetical protein n=1 Tax=Massilia sp. TaxID=1882437 RepID=UPI002897C363|nr:hypothetical protein [Massilia sp.]
MPYIALNSKDEEVTASQCRDEFLRTGEVLSGFRCAFCLCAYHPRYIYINGMIGRTPHFFVKGEKHNGRCDGNPLGVVAETVSGTQGKRIPDDNFCFPEKLVARAKPRVVASLPDGEKLVLSDEEIRSRRLRAGKEYGSTTFTSSLLEVIVESKNKISTWCYSQSRKQKLTKEAEKKLLKETASSYPLQLFDQKGLTYESAFWNAHYERTKTDKRIFQAKGGTVTVSSSGFVISSQPSAPSNGGNESKKAVPRPVEVHYHRESYDSNTPPQAHVKALAELANVAAGETIQWYAYGEMRLHEDKLIIRVETLDHLYFRKEKKFTPRKAS